MCGGLPLADLAGFSRRLSLVDPCGFGLYSCVDKLDPFDLHFSSMAVVVALMRWSYRASARRLLDSLLQQDLPSLDERGDDGDASTAPLIAGVTSWSMNLHYCSFRRGKNGVAVSTRVDVET